MLVGASASVVRAAIMGGLALVAQRIGRRTLGLNTLSAAVIVLTLLNPLTLWDVGFQLLPAQPAVMVMSQYLLDKAASGPWKAGFWRKIQPPPA